jgi:hypothetical protein
MFLDNQPDITNSSILSSITLSTHLIDLSHILSRIEIIWGIISTFTLFQLPLYLPALFTSFLNSPNLEELITSTNFLVALSITALLIISEDLLKSAQLLLLIGAPGICPNKFFISS